jgi:hypothetical protein
MKIGNVRLKVPITVIVVIVFFTILLSVYYLLTGDRSLLIIGVPTIILLLVFPLALNYMSQREYRDLAPVYEAKAKTVRIKSINQNSIGSIVRIEGIVERTYFQFINRPQFLVADRSGEISVKMFTNPDEDVKKGDIVEVYGMVIHRYMMTGDAVVNGVVIRKLAKPSQQAGNKVE